MGNKTNAYKSRVTSFNKKALLTKKLFSLFLLDLSRKDDPINQLDPLSHLDDERDWSLRRSFEKARSRKSIKRARDAKGKSLLCGEREENVGSGKSDLPGAGRRPRSNPNRRRSKTRGQIPKRPLFGRFLGFHYWLWQ